MGTSEIRLSIKWDARELSHLKAIPQVSFKQEELTASPMWPIIMTLFLSVGMQDLWMHMPERWQAILYRGDKRKEPNEILITVNVIEVDRWRSQWHPQWGWQDPRVVGNMLLLQNARTGHHSGNSSAPLSPPNLHPHIYKHISTNLVSSLWS